MIVALTLTALALAAAGVLSTCALVVRRLYLTRKERQVLEAEGRLRPLALALLDGDEAEAASASPRDLEILAVLLARLGRQLRGVARDRLAAFFEGTLGVERAVARLGARRPWRRATAAHALGDMASPRAIPPLLEALDDPVRAVRAAAARSLGRLGAVEAVDPLVYALAEREVPRAIAGQALLAIGDAAVPALRQLESAQAAEVRAVAIELVGLLGDASDGVRLAELLRDASAEVRAKAARALGRLGAREGAEQLRATLHDRIPFVRAAAAIALGEIRDGNAVADLAAVARTDDSVPARAAAYALARIDPSALTGGPYLDEAADVLALVR